MRLTYCNLGLTAIAAAVCLSPPPADAGTKLRAAIIHSSSQTQAKALHKWKELLKEASKGELDVQVFDSGSVVANQQDAFGQVKVGSIDLTLSVAVKDDLPALQIPLLAYAFPSYEAWRSFMDGEEAQKLYDQFREKTGLRILGMQYIGARHLTANRAVKTPADLKGLKIRAVELPLFLETVKGLGGLPTPVALQEVVSGLKTGVIDGQENPIPTIYSLKMQDAQSHLMLTGHIRGGDFWMINEARFKSLTPQQQELVVATARRAIKRGDDLVRQQEDDFLAKLKADGMTVIGPEQGLDVAAFTRSVRDNAWPVLVPDIGTDVVDRVLALEKK